ncbi:hemerythrin domain-containing protein [Oceaniglobus indicus]|uniref:hemerythrin domain-containing protein n=1 Tax=Oceaniglobus indicus TaxID=2047749 RepID=UPI000C1A0AF5|nr:hemerythrin domain-containing protein [Oceaniglobus indicus]
MTHKRGGRANPDRGGSDNTGPIDNPLDFLARDHQREREVCAVIDRLVAADRVPAAERQMVIAFLTNRLPHHLADEENDLFPMLRNRCGPDEEIGNVIDKLEADHLHTVTDAARIAAFIAKQGQGDGTFPAPARTAMAEFATDARCHLILENAIILPIARACLTAGDLNTMRRNMHERRERDRRQEN